MTGTDLSGLAELRFKRGAGILIGALTFLVSILVFFTEPSLSAKPVAHVSVQMSVTMFCIFLMYTSMSDAGCRAGEERGEYVDARAEWTRLADRVRRSEHLSEVAGFCRRLAVEEREEARADRLAAAGLSLRDYRELPSDAARYRALPRRTRRAIRRARAVRLLRLSPDRLLSSSGRGRRRIAPVSPGASRVRSTVFAMIPALAGTFLTVSVAFTAADGLTASAAISAAFRLLALLWTGFRGYGMGYRSVVRDGVTACKTRAALLHRFLSECGDGETSARAE